MIFKKVQKNKGFSLIETLVAIAILLIAIMAPLTLVTDSLTASYFARDQITASFLAQEGVELVKNMIGSNTLRNNLWTNGLGDKGTGTVCFSSDGCRIDTTVPLSAINCTTNCPYLLYDQATKKYSYSIGNTSIFRRSIRLISVASNPNEIEIESKISWETGKFSKEVIVKENILNWQCSLSNSPC